MSRNAAAPIARAPGMPDGPRPLTYGTPSIDSDRV
jgi:hypothetical protein